MDESENHVSNNEDEESYDSNIEEDREKNEDNETFRNLEKAEKYKLLQLITSYGSKNLDVISEELSSRSKKELREIFRIYRRKAKKAMVTKKIKKTKSVFNETMTLKSKSALLPLGMWSDTLTQNFSFKDLETVTPTALHLISQCEIIPSSSQTSNVDFKLIYTAIANAMEGRPLPKINENTNYVLNKCIYEGALATNNFIGKNQLDYILSSINVKENPVFIKPGSTTKAELAAIRHLSCQRAYNPLNISEDHLYLMRSV